MLPGAARTYDLNLTYNRICTWAKTERIWPADQFFFSLISKVIKIPSKPQSLLNEQNLATVPFIILLQNSQARE